MDVDGLWTVDFSTPGGTGYGVIVLSNNRLLGGDSGYYYSGHYSLKSSQISAMLTATHYAGPLDNVFGPLRSVTLKIEGAVGSDLIMAQGISMTSPKLFGTFRLHRVQSI